MKFKNPWLGKAKIALIQDIEEYIDSRIRGHYFYSKDTTKTFCFNLKTQACILYGMMENEVRIDWHVASNLTPGGNYYYVGMIAALDTDDIDGLAIFDMFYWT